MTNSFSKCAGVASLAVASLSLMQGCACGSKVCKVEGGSEGSKNSVSLKFNKKKEKKGETFVPGGFVYDVKSFSCKSAEKESSFFQTDEKKPSFGEKCDVLKKSDLIRAAVDDACNICSEDQLKSQTEDRFFVSMARTFLIQSGTGSPSDYEQLCLFSMYVIENFFKNSGMDSSVSAIKKSLDRYEKLNDETVLGSGLYNSGFAQMTVRLLDVLENEASKWGGSLHFSDVILNKSSEEGAENKNSVKQDEEFDLTKMANKAKNHKNSREIFEQILDLFYYDHHNSEEKEAAEALAQIFQAFLEGVMSGSYTAQGGEGDDKPHKQEEIDAAEGYLKGTGKPEKRPKKKGEEKKGFALAL